MAKPELGAKRQCQSCGVKFFDLNRDPAVCPKCGAVFHVPMRTASRSGGEAEDKLEVQKDAAEVSLEEVEAAEKVETTDADEGMEIDEDVEDDDTFLEEEEDGDDDVSGLIDGDLDTDEET